MSRDYKKLKVFHQVNDLVIDIYRVTESFPKNEMFGLISQIRRAAVSAAANIVEGSYRSTLKEYLQFLNISLSSLAEVGYYIELSHTLNYMNDEEHRRLSEKQHLCVRILNALISSLKSKA